VDFSLGQNYAKNVTMTWESNYHIKLLSYVAFYSEVNPFIAQHPSLI